MSYTAISKIGIRLVAVYLMATGMMAIPAWAELVFQHPQSDTTNLSRGLYLSGVLAPFAFGVIIWFLGPLVAKWMLPADQTEGTSFDVDTLQRAAFAVLGVYLVVMNFPVLVGLLIRAASYSAHSQANYDYGQSPWHDYRIYTAALRSIFGVGLVVGGGYLMRLIDRIREFGLVRPNSESS